MKHPVRTGLALFLVIVASACASGQPAATPPPAPSEQPVETHEPTDLQEPLPAQADCGGKTCAPPEQCIRYYGVAGLSVPLHTCGQPCGDQGECPSGLECATIADGPRLCR